MCHVLNCILQYLSRFSLVPTFSEEDFQHWFLPREDIIDAYVVERPTTGGASRITDLVSFYTLPSTVMSHPTHNKLKAAYSFYNVATTASWVDLIGDALVLAKKVATKTPYLFLHHSPFILHVRNQAFRTPTKTAESQHY